MTNAALVASLLSWPVKPAMAEPLAGPDYDAELYVQLVHISHVQDMIHRAMRDNRVQTHLSTNVDEAGCNAIVNRVEDGRYTMSDAYFPVAYDWHNDVGNGRIPDTDGIGTCSIFSLETP